MTYDLPTIRSINDIQKHFPDIIIIDNYNSYENFDSLYDKILQVIYASFGIPNLNFQIKFKFYIDDPMIYELSLPKFILNLNAWRPLLEINTLQEQDTKQIKIFDQSFIVGSMMNKTVRLGLQSKVIKLLTEYGISFDRISVLIKTVLERYQELSLEFALLTPGSIFTLENCFLNDYIHSEKIRELNNLQISQEVQTADVEIMLRKKHTELMFELGKSNNPIWYVSKAGNHIKDKQVDELFISYGQLPDISGNVIPYTMKGNGFATGMIDPVTYYIAATGARLSAIVNKQSMGDAGYLSRNLILLSRTMTLSNTMWDCGTKHFLKLKVINPTFLQRLENRWYSKNLDTKLDVIHYETCKHLIGEEIYIRSIVTCAGGNEVCHVCYGKDSHLVMNMPGMAIFNTEAYSSPVSQDILSTKHLLFTAANKLTFNESFNKYFKFSAGDIFVIDKEDWDPNINSGHLTIRIPEDHVQSVNQQDLQEYNTFGNNIISPFYIYNVRTGDYDLIEIVNYESMFIDAATIKLFKKVQDRKRNATYFEISLDTIANELEGRLLSVDIKNNGLTDNLYSIMNLVNKEAGKYTDYNELAQYFFEMLIKAGIRCRHLQGEIILNRLIVDVNNLSKRPNFLSYKMPEYKILSLNQALLNNWAPTIGMSYQELKRQLLNDQLYNKDGHSYLDPLYNDTVPTKRLKELHQLVRNKRNRGTV